MWCVSRISTDPKYKTVVQPIAKTVITLMESIGKAIDKKLTEVSLCDLTTSLGTLSLSETQKASLDSVNRNCKQSWTMSLKGYAKLVQQFIKLYKK